MQRKILSRCNVQRQQGKAPVGLSSRTYPDGKFGEGAKQRAKRREELNKKAGTGVAQSIFEELEELRSYSTGLIVIDQNAGENQYNGLPGMKTKGKKKLAWKVKIKFMRMSQTNGAKVMVP